MKTILAFLILALPVSAQSLELKLALAKAKAKAQQPAADDCPCDCQDCAHGTGEPCSCPCLNCTCPKASRVAALVPAADSQKGQPAAHGGASDRTSGASPATIRGKSTTGADLTWDASTGEWVWPDGKRAKPFAKKPVKRTVTIPAKGYWQTTCGRNGCTRRWIQTAPARTIQVDATSAQRWPGYPNRPLGRRWTFNGGNITAAHLANPCGHHAHERFDPHWLNSLSRNQLNALGSDSHNGQVRSQFVVRR